MDGGLAVDILPLGSGRSNIDLVCAGRDAIEKTGGELASAAEVRAALS